MIRIRAASSPGELRVAIMDGEAAIDFALWRPGRPDGVGDIHRARVTAHVSGLAGAFVALPDGDGFLPDSQGAVGVREGDLLTVQTTRAAQGGKGARVTAQLPQLAGPPGLVTRGPNPLEAAIARFPDAPVEVDDPQVAAGLGRRATLAAVDLDELYAALVDPVMDLPGGVRATIQPTRALVAIDLDMAGLTAGRQPKAAAQLAANQAAMPALARQIRLRNLSGAIFVDPAGLSIRRRPALGPALAAALAEDPLQPRLLGFTALGLAEIVRPRIHPPLHELASGPHAAGMAALRTIARESAAAPHAIWRLRAAQDVAGALRDDPVALADLTRRTGRSLVPEADPSRPACSWLVEKVS